MQWVYSVSIFYIFVLWSHHIFFLLLFHFITFLVVWVHILLFVYCLIKISLIWVWTLEKFVFFNFLSFTKFLIVYFLNLIDLWIRLRAMKLYWSIILRIDLRLFTIFTASAFASLSARNTKRKAFTIAFYTSWFFTCAPFSVL